MSNVYVAIYFIAFALIAGGAFALMWGNIQSINKLMDNPPPKTRHPEAPQPGETVMYVDLEKEKLEKLFNNEETKEQTLD